jgi:hypothetical protein
MSLKFSDRPVLHYGNPSPTDRAIANLPAGAQSLHTAPAGRTQIIDRADMRVYEAHHRREAWRKLGPNRNHDGSVTWYETGELIQQPIAWLPRRQQGR